MQDFKEHLSIIVPCFNEATNINEFYKRMIKVLNTLKIEKYKFIFVDDGSSDLTWEEIKKKNILDPLRVSGIKLTRNFGHQHALLAGLDIAESKYILTIDCDLQDPPEMLNEMYKVIVKKEFNIVSCQRRSRKDSFFKKITAKIFYTIFNFFSNIKINSEVSDFKLFDNKVHKILKKFKEQDPFIRGIISWPGYKEKKILFDRDKRYSGRSGWSLSKMFNFSLNAFFGFSSYPMRLSFILCIFLSIIFLILVVYVVYGYINGQNIKGWTSLVLIIVFFQIFNFFILGLISEYTGRIYFEVKDRPRYIIEKVL